MNSTRRRWQTTGSRAPGATLGLRRRAAAAAPTNLASYAARPLHLPVLVCCAPRADCAAQRGEKGRKRTRHGAEERGEKDRRI